MSPNRPRSGRADDKLESWKEIAAYLHRDVRTAVRWERMRGLPVYRVPGGGKAGVYALKSELDSWWKGASLQMHEDATDTLAQTPTPSVAVLPFSNLSPDKANEYFGDGLADGIITLLTRIPRLRVTARTSSFAFRGREQDVRVIGARLGVKTLLEGSVQLCAERVRVCAQLVETTNGFHLWSEQYDRAIADVYAIQDEVARAIATALQLRLAPPRGERPSVNPEAYRYWLKGRYYQQYETLSALDKCRTCMEQAIRLDPKFPQPYLGLAEVLLAAATFSTLRPREALEQGLAAIGRAFELDDSQGEAYAIRGAYRALGDFDWEGADADFERALELAPASAEVRWYRTVNVLVPTGRLREAQQEMQRAVDSDPVSPLAYIELGKVLIWAREYSRAQEKMVAAFELRPDYPLGLWFRGSALYFQGHIEQAVALWQAALGKIGGFEPLMLGFIGMGLGQLGRHDEARAALAQLAAAANDRYITPMSQAPIHLGLGDIDAAFEYLDQAVEERDPLILDLPCKPIWDGLRSDARFTALLRKMRLA